MACCAAVLWLISRVVAGVRAVAGRPAVAPVSVPRQGGPGLVIGGLVEIGMALIAVRYLRFGMQMRGSHIDGSDMRGSVPAPASGVPWNVVIGLASLVAALLLCAVLVLRGVPSSRAVPVALITGIAPLPVTRHLAAGSHLALMLLLDLTLVAFPALLVGLRPPRRTTGVPGAIVGSLACSVVLLALHVPRLHEQIMSGDSVPFLGVVVAAFAGVLLWTALRGSLSSRPAVLLILAVPFELSAVVGLAMLSAPSTFEATRPILGLTADADTRVGGIVMLTGCLASLVALSRRHAPPTADVSTARPQMVYRMSID